VQAGALAVVVLAATGAGFVALRSAFRESRQNVGENVILPANGEIVFSAGGADGHVHLYAMQPDGSGQRQIADFATDDTSPAVSPDGRTVAFVHQLEDVAPSIATIPIGGGVVTWLTDPDFFVTDGPTWSPDGTRIAFAATRGEGQRIYVMGADGSDPRPITPRDVFWPDGPSWSPDGTKIAFAASPISGDDEPSVWDIYTISPDGGELTNVTQTPDRLLDEGGPTWSPDGERIAFVRNALDGSTIVIRRLSDGVETLVTDGAFVEGSPAWSPDGRWIAFHRSGVERDPGEHPAQQDLWLVHPDGTGETRLTMDGAFAPAWQSIPVGASPTPEPSASPSPEPAGKDVGLGFNLCDLHRLGGVDWFGDGTEGTAWTGTRVGDDGRCGNESVGSILVADLDGDASADVWTTVDACTACEPWAATDLDGNGTDELVVLLLADLQPVYSFFFAVPDGRPRDSGIYPILLERGEAIETGLPPEQTVRVVAGAGEEGASANAIRCEGYPDDPVLVVARWVEDERNGDVEYHGAKLRLVTSADRLHSHFEIVETFTPTATSEDFGGDGDACGVDFNPWN
jgi:WD40-like Beta Propeller Repeat